MTQTGSMGLISAAQRTRHPRPYENMMVAFAARRKRLRQLQLRFGLHQKLRADDADDEHCNCCNAERHRRAQVCDARAINEWAQTAADEERERVEGDRGTS